MFMSETVEAEVQFDGVFKERVDGLLVDGVFEEGVDCLLVDGVFEEGVDCLLVDGVFEEGVNFFLEMGSRAALVLVENGTVALKATLTMAVTSTASF